ncbi:MAG TPA: hypothetical protein VGT04_03425 [Acidobacteriaceae bacterium]|nr:hypothetical protein [Acidobacteriaceae bacterium]
MENEEIVLLLREIRDLQKQHVENYRDALKNQQESIELQAKAGRLQKRSLIILLVVVLVGIAIAVLPSLITH